MLGSQTIITDIKKEKKNVLFIISCKSYKVIYQDKQDKIIIRRELPIGVFLFDSIRTFFGGSQDYKPLQWIGRIIEIIQLILTFFIFMPLIGEIYLFLKQNIEINGKEK